MRITNFLVIPAFLLTSNAFGEIREIKTIDEVETAIAPGTSPLVCFDVEDVLLQATVSSSPLRNLIDYVANHGSDLDPTITELCIQELFDQAQALRIQPKSVEETTIGLVRKLQGKHILTMAITSVGRAADFLPSVGFNFDCGFFKHCHRSYVCAAEFRHGVLVSRENSGKKRAFQTFLEEMNKELRPFEKCEIKHVMCVSADQPLLMELEAALTSQPGIEFVGLHYTFVADKIAAYTYDGHALAQEFDALVARAKEAAAKQ